MFRCCFSTNQTFGIHADGLWNQPDKECWNGMKLSPAGCGHHLRHLWCLYVGGLQYIAQIGISSGKSHITYINISDIIISWWHCSMLQGAIYPHEFWWLCFEYWLFLGLLLCSTKGWRPIPWNHRQEQWNQMTSSAPEEDKPVDPCSTTFKLNNQQLVDGLTSLYQSQHPMHQILQLCFLTGRLDYPRLQIECLRKGHFTLKSTTFVFKRSIWLRPFSQDHLSHHREFRSPISASSWKWKMSASQKSTHFTI